MPDFKLADAEFDRQATILEELVKAIELIGQQDANNPVVIGGQALFPPPPGGQNTMAAAAMVLLGAHFEEYMRQQVEEFAKAAIDEFDHMEPDQQEKFVDNYWKAGSSRIGRIRPKGDPAWATGAQTLLLQLLEYPVRQNISAFIANMVAEHDNNMRWDTITEITGRVGIQKLSDKLFKSAPLKAQIGNPKKDNFTPSLRMKLNEFYITRNGIVHSISQNAGIGPTIVTAWIAFFRILTTALADAIEACHIDFIGKIATKKAKAVSVAHTLHEA